MSKTFVPTGAKIKVVGLGGAGCNAITRMVREQIRGVEFIAMNTDSQQLALTEASVRLQLGERLTRGMGGGTGTGSAPVVSEIAKANGALTIAIVTKPFTFEGKHRTGTAMAGIEELQEKVDTLVIIPNDRLLQLCDQKASLDSAFRRADDVLHAGVQAIAEVITVPGLINLDFADIRTIMKDAGPAWMSIGKGTGPNRAADAAREALASPLLDVQMEGAKGVLFNVTGGSTLTLFEVNAAAEIVKQAVDPDANVIFGVAMDSNMGAEVRLTLVATGFGVNTGIGSATHEKELTKILKNIKTEAQMDTPSFLRQRDMTVRPRPTPVEIKR